MYNSEEIQFHNDLRELSEYVYRINNTLTPSGYTLLSTTSGKNGFFACVVQKGNDVVIVIRGTENWHDKDDIKNDLQMFMRRIPEQYQDAKALYEEVAEYCYQNGYQLTVTGHSLGGS